MNTFHLTNRFRDPEYPYTLHQETERSRIFHGHFVSAQKALECVPVGVSCSMFIVGDASAVNSLPAR